MIATRLRAAIAVSTLLAGAAGGAVSAAGSGGRCDTAMLVFDASESMLTDAGDGTSRMELARKAVRDVLPGLSFQRDLGLVLYGVPKGGMIAGDPICSARIALAVAPRPAAAGPIIDAVEAVAPGGATPLTEAVRLAVTAPALSAPPSTVVLVTDGRENCSRSPCELGKSFRRKFPGLTVHVIGFHIDLASDEELRCLAVETGGTLQSVAGAAALGAALTETLGCPTISLVPPRGPILAHAPD